MRQFKCDGMNCASWTTVPDTMSKTSFCGIGLIPATWTAYEPPTHFTSYAASLKIPSLNIPLLLGFISSHFISSAIRSTSIAAWRVLSLIDVDGKRC